jgi:uncharacterized membrane protein
VRDLGTLGGPDSAAEVNNDRGEVTGWSYTSFVANPSSGTPNVDPFLWSPEDGKMTDLGSLGGTSDLHSGSIIGDRWWAHQTCPVIKRFIHSFGTAAS